MSKSSQIAVGILVAVVIVGGVWYALAAHYNTNQSEMYGMSSTQTTTPITTNSSSVTPAQPSQPTPDNSDAAINQSLQGIDTQMNGMSSDNTTAQQSLTPPQQ